MPSQKRQKEEEEEEEELILMAMEELIAMPLELVEEKMMLLDDWLEEDPDDPDVPYKREEYLGLWEELEILAKKLRKTCLLLKKKDKNDNKEKLQRKQQQYQQELQDILEYMQDDPFFDNDDNDNDDNDNDFDQSLQANSLLGKPLETLIEMAELENSQRFPSSPGDQSRNSIDLTTTQKGKKVIRRGSKPAKQSSQQQQSQSSSPPDFQSSSSSLGVEDLKLPPARQKQKQQQKSSQNKLEKKNVTILKKKLKKIQQMINEAKTEKEKRKLEKKRQEYLEQLGDDDAGNIDQQGSSDDGISLVSSDDDTALVHRQQQQQRQKEQRQKQLQEEEQKRKKQQEEEEQRRLFEEEQAMLLRRQKMEQEAEEEAERLNAYDMLKKKLSKAGKMLAKSSSDKEKSKLEKKIQEYLDLLDDHPEWMEERASYGYKKDVTEKEVLRHEQQKDARLQILEAEEKAKMARLDERRVEARAILGASRSYSKSNLYEQETNDTQDKDDNDNDDDGEEGDDDHSCSPEEIFLRGQQQHGIVHKKLNASGCLDPEILQERDEMEREIFMEAQKEVRKIQKKLLKVNEMIQNMINEEEDEETLLKNKEYKKLLKKQRQYQSELTEYPGNNNNNNNNSGLASSSGLHFSGSYYSPRSLAAVAVQNNGGMLLSPLSSPLSLSSASSPSSSASPPRSSPHSALKSSSPQRRRPSLDSIDELLDDDDDDDGDDDEDHGNDDNDNTSSDDDSDTERTTNKRIDIAKISPHSSPNQNNHSSHSSANHHHHHHNPPREEKQLDTTNNNNNKHKKEIKILQKKLSKIRDMILDAEDDQKPTKKLHKKEAEYISQLEQLMTMPPRSQDKTTTTTTTTTSTSTNMVNSVPSNHSSKQKDHDDDDDEEEEDENDSVETSDHDISPFRRSQHTKASTDSSDFEIGSESSQSDNDDDNHGADDDDDDGDDDHNIDSHQQHESSGGNDDDADDDNSHSTAGMSQDISIMSHDISVLSTHSINDHQLEGRHQKPRHSTASGIANTGSSHQKEVKVLQKKLAKVQEMIHTAKNQGKDTQKLFKKHAEYTSQLKKLQPPVKKVPPAYDDDGGGHRDNTGKKTTPTSAHDEMEVKTLQKKLRKVEQMIEEAQTHGKKTNKLEQKKAEYTSQLSELQEQQRSRQDGGVTSDPASEFRNTAIRALRDKIQKVEDMIATAKAQGRNTAQLDSKKTKYLSNLHELLGDNHGSSHHHQTAATNYTTKEEDSDSDSDSEDDEADQKARAQKERIDELKRKRAEAEAARLKELEEQKAKIEEERLKQLKQLRLDEEKELQRQARIKEIAVQAERAAKEEKAAKEAQKQRIESLKRQMAEAEAARLKKLEEEKAKIFALQQEIDPDPPSEAKPSHKQQHKEKASETSERQKEFKLMKKKLSKLETMISDAEKTGKDTTKLFKKKKDYLSTLESFDEWKADKDYVSLGEENGECNEGESEETRLEEDKVPGPHEKSDPENLPRDNAEESSHVDEQVYKEEERRRNISEEADESHSEEQHSEEAEEEEEDAEEVDGTEEVDETEEVKAAEEVDEPEDVGEMSSEGEDGSTEPEQTRLDSEQPDHEEANDKLQGMDGNDIDGKNDAEVNDMSTTQTDTREETKSIQEPNNEKPQSTAESQGFVDRSAIPEPYSENTKRILQELEDVQNRQDRLEKTLKQNGHAVSEDIPYELSKEKITMIQRQMMELQNSAEDPFIAEKKMYQLQEDFSKYMTAMTLTDEWAEEQQLAEENWENSVSAGNMEALRKIRTHMPINIRNMSEDELTSQPTPNGKTLSKAHAKKFKRSNILQLIRTDPSDLERMHPSLLEGMRTTGMTLTERRALHEHLKYVAGRWRDMQADPSVEKKWQWFSSLKSKLKEDLTKYGQHVEQYGPPGNHPYAKRNDPGGRGCPLLGNQCPVKADSAISYDEDYGFTPDAEYEHSEAQKSSLNDSSQHHETNPTKAKKSSRSIGRMSAKAKDDELMSVIRERLALRDAETDIEKQLFRELFFAEKRALSLEKQLAQHGLAIPKEDISYAVAKSKVAEITEEIKMIAIRMGEVTDPKEMAVVEKDYSKLSDELEKYNNALMLTKEWAAEQIEKERLWEKNVCSANQEALRKIRRHMPVNVRDLSEDDMINGTTPNGQKLPQKIVRKFKRTNILLLLRTDWHSIEPMHPSSLEGMRTTGLTFTERSALHEHLKDLGAKWKAASNDKMAERKWLWHESLRSKFKELSEKWQQHVEQYGPPGNHPYATRNDPSGGCPLLGKQCPLKADLDIDYSGDFGFPEEAIYNVEDVQKSHLLTVEDLERRKQEDEDGFGGSMHSSAPSREPETAPRPPIPGMMSAIASHKREDTERGPPSRAPSGLLRAISSKKQEDAETKAAPARAPSGLLSAITARKDSGGGGKNPMAGGLLAAIAARKK